MEVWFDRSRWFSLPPSHMDFHVDSWTLDSPKPLSRKKTDRCHNQGEKANKNIPAPSKGWCLNPKGLLSGTVYHPFGTPWRVQVQKWKISSDLWIYDHKIWAKYYNSNNSLNLNSAEVAMICPNKIKWRLGEYSIPRCAKCRDDLPTWKVQNGHIQSKMAG